MLQDKNKIQISQLHAAIQKIVAIAPDFLSKKIPAEKMADTMIKAVQGYAVEAEKEGFTKPQTEEAVELYEVLEEILGCGSGFLENRCDSACVARTITGVVKEFS